jgi:hypothetical protein
LATGTRAHDRPGFFLSVYYSLMRHLRLLSARLITDLSEVLGWSRAQNHGIRLPGLPHRLTQLVAR